MRWIHVVVVLLLLLLLLGLPFVLSLAVPSSRQRRQRRGLNDPEERQISVLAKALRVMYQQGGTLAVLRRSEGMQDYEGESLVRAAMEASHGDKGVASGILNALIGSCCLYQDSVAGALQACALMKAYDAQNAVLEPDLVSLCLAYVATCPDESLGGTQAEGFLRRAENLYPTPATVDEAKSQPDWAAVKAHGIDLFQETDD